ncbi:MAG: hypothetical protein NZ932_03890 [Candidatus Bathyarchaeota archaeon]|nr:hypothetical protein [Candidatus Bathyarchaeota archaeon]MDW8022390.1 hypothetical protein [Nitrososphaerota archaeon]
MTGSEYEIPIKNAEEILQKFRRFKQNNKLGSEHSVQALGETLTVRLSRTLCSEKYPYCEVEFEDTKYGGLANFKVDAKTGRIEIVGSDFPYPGEYVIAEELLGIPIKHTDDYCIVVEHFLHCSKRRW